MSQALGKTTVIGGTTQGATAVDPGVQGSGILEALEKQGCNENPDKPSCIKLIENAENFQLQIGNVVDDFGGPANVRLPPIVNIQPTEITLSSSEHSVVEIPVFWWSEFERHQAEATVIEITPDKEILGVSFEGTPKKLFGTNDKIHAIVDGEFLPNPEEAIEVTVKIQVGEQVQTSKDMMFISVMDHEELSFIDQILNALGIQ